MSGGDREYVFRTRDLSEHGLFLYTRVAHVYPIQVGSTLDLELYDYDQPIACKVVVARVVEPRSAEAADYPAGFGVRIIEMAEGSRRALADLLSRLERGEQPY